MKNPRSTDASGDTDSNTNPYNPNDTSFGTDPGDSDTNNTPITLCQGCSGFDGVDILVVVDNSSSMGEEQQILASGFFTLINSLVAPVAGWPYSAARDVRVGIVSSDLGMQFGTAGGAAPQAAKNITGCDDDTDGRGEDGVFQSNPLNLVSVLVDSNRIKCDPDGAQCPPGFTCNHNGTEGYCLAPNGAAQGQVNCSGTPYPWADYTNVSMTPLARDVACMAQLGTNGCGIEQQLQAGVRALQRQDQVQFARPNYLLAVIVVSDEEDCSMMTDGLFSLPGWDASNPEINVICNYPEANENNNLFDAAYFRQSLVNIKSGNADAVLFAAIVGVPAGAGSPCQGTGDKIGGCLQAQTMQYVPTEFTAVSAEGQTYTYTHFAPACERADSTGQVVTSARPGRRYVKVAQAFGCASYVYSICNQDWSEAMLEIARLIASCLVV